MVTLLFGAQFHRDHIGTRPALAHREGSEVFAGDKLWKVAGLLIIIAPTAQLVDAEVRVGAVGEADRGGSAGDLFHRDNMFEIAEAGAAPLLFDSNAEEAEFTHLGQQVARERVRPVDLGSAGRDFVLGKVFHGFADHVRSFTEIEVQRGICVRDHVT